MSMGELLASGLAAVFNPGMFFMVCLAIVLGTIFGALPGVSATMAVALGLTFTYTMEPIPAIVFLTAIYCSSITGGSITAILFKIPGVPSSAPTTFDGYPMAKEGKAGKALGTKLPGQLSGKGFKTVLTTKKDGSDITVLQSKKDPNSVVILMYKKPQAIAASLKGDFSDIEDWKLGEEE